MLSWNARPTRGSRLGSPSAPAFKVGSARSSPRRLHDPSPFPLRLSPHMTQRPFPRSRLSTCAPLLSSCVTFSSTISMRQLPTRLIDGGLPHTQRSSFRPTPSRLHKKVSTHAPMRNGRSLSLGKRGGESSGAEPGSSTTGTFEFAIVCLVLYARQSQTIHTGSGRM